MKKLVYKARKEADGGMFHIPNRKVMEDDLRQLPKGNYTLTIEKYKKKASYSQFGWLYGAIYPQMLIALNDAGYEFATVEEVDQFCKMMWASKEVLNPETGELMKLPMNKREFLTIDHMGYVSCIRKFAAEYLSTNIVDPDPDWKKRQQEIFQKLDSNY
jgi:hypothetical protein